MDRTDLSLVLGAFSALAIVTGRTTAALVTAAFVAGLLLGQRRRTPP